MDGASTVGQRTIRRAFPGARRCGGLARAVSPRRPWLRLVPGATSEPSRHPASGLHVRRGDGSIDPMHLRTISNRSSLPQPWTPCQRARRSRPAACASSPTTIEGRGSTRGSNGSRSAATSSTSAPLARRRRPDRRLGRIPRRDRGDDLAARRGQQCGLRPHAPRPAGNLPAVPGARHQPRDPHDRNRGRRSPRRRCPPLRFRHHRDRHRRQRAGAHRGPGPARRRNDHRAAADRVGTDRRL